jgi:hypothetical protein
MRRKLHLRQLPAPGVRRGVPRHHHDPPRRRGPRRRSWEFPYPTALVIDRSGIVGLADVHPNWMVRTESTVLLAQLRHVLGQATH